MALVDFKIKMYRSIKELWLKLQPINVIVGPNGCGKSNLYRAMYLVATTANGQFSRALAEEGGIASALWAGPYSKHENPGEMSLSVRVERFEYNMVCSPIGTVLRPPPFASDPHIKEEDVYLFKGESRHQLLKRRGPTIDARDSRGNKLDYTMEISESESVLSVLRDPQKFPDLFRLRQEFLDWRFYHHFRTDPDSPLRKPQIGVYTPIMAHDGRDFAAALLSIRVSPMADMFEQALQDAFPKARLDIYNDGSRGVHLLMSTPGTKRMFKLSELSDGTLQYLCLLGALLSPRAPSVLAINEPENSIHPSLYEPLARLIVAASDNSQIWITTHSQVLSDLILEYSGYKPLELKKVKGETRLKGVGLGGYREEDDDKQAEDV